MTSEYAMTDCPLFTQEDCRERPDVIGGGASRISYRFSETAAKPCW